MMRANHRYYITFAAVVLLCISTRAIDLNGALKLRSGTSRGPVVQVSSLANTASNIMGHIIIIIILLSRYLNMRADNSDG